MENLNDDKRLIQEFRDLVNRKESIDPEFLLRFAERYEEMTELAEISIQMVDHLVKKHHLQN